MQQKHCTGDRLAAIAVNWMHLLAALTLFIV
jgi:hypothetical protein